jgi:cell division initiation protein
MKISTVTVKKHEFSKSTRGYNVKEVEAFSERLADDIDIIQKENDDLKNQVEETNIQLEEYKKKGQSLNENIVKAKETSAKQLETAEKKSAAIIKEAEVRAYRILEKVRLEAKEIKNSIIELREEKNLIVAKLKAIINSQARLLDMKFSEDDDGMVYSEEQKMKLEQKEKVSIDVENIVERLSSLS